MEAGLLPTSTEVDGSTWKQYVAFMEAGATCMEAGLLLTSMEVGGISLEVDVGRWKLS